MYETLLSDGGGGGCGCGGVGMNLHGEPGGRPLRRPAFHSRPDRLPFDKIHIKSPGDGAYIAKIGKIPKSRFGASLVPQYCR